MTLRLRRSIGRPRRMRSVLAPTLFGVCLIAIVALVSGMNTVRPLTRFELPDVSPEVSPVAVVVPVVLATSGVGREKGGQPIDEPTATPPPIFMGWPPGVVIDVPATLQPTPSPSAAPTDSGLTAEAQPLKAVVIVGPTNEETSTNLARGEDFAQHAESNGMDVRRVFFPHATWKNVLANIQGANLVAYFGHGNGWPSIYGSFQESTKDGFGLDSYDGGTDSEVTYYGANRIRHDIKLAPNAVVVLSHLCYSAGNAEPGLPLPTEAIALERVDNYATAFLNASVGALAVFAYGSGSATTIVDGLFGRDRTMDEIFMIRGRMRQPYYGFVGWQDRYFDSSRNPGFRNHLDPGETEGYLRAISGDLEMTNTEWAAGDFGSPTPKP